jgi:hypothetical protein
MRNGKIVFWAFPFIALSSSERLNDFSEKIALMIFLFKCESMVECDE